MPLQTVIITTEKGTVVVEDEAAGEEAAEVAEEEASETTTETAIETMVGVVTKKLPMTTTGAVTQSRNLPGATITTMDLEEEEAAVEVVAVAVDAAGAVGVEMETEAAVEKVADMEIMMAEVKLKVARRLNGRFTSPPNGEPMRSFSQAQLRQG